MNEKLTAYALHELPPDERAEIEARMKSDPALREQVEEMKSFCALLKEEAAGDESPALTPQQRVSVMQAFTSEAPVKEARRSFWRGPAFLVPATLAACAVIALVWPAREPEILLAAKNSPRSTEPSRGVQASKGQQLEKRSDSNSPVGVPHPSAPGEPSPVTSATVPAMPPMQLPDIGGSFTSPQSGSMPTASPVANNVPADQSPSQLGNEGSLTKIGDGLLTLNGEMPLRGNLGNSRTLDATKIHVTPPVPASGEILANAAAEGMKLPAGESSSLASTGGVTKSGSGVWVLNGANTYSGTMTINGGVVALGDSAAIPGAGPIAGLGGGSVSGVGLSAPPAPSVSFDNSGPMQAGSGTVAVGGPVTVGNTSTASSATFRTGQPAVVPGKATARREDSGRTEGNATAAPASVGLTVNVGQDSKAAYKLNSAPTADMPREKGNAAVHTPPPPPAAPVAPAPIAAATRAPQEGSDQTIRESDQSRARADVNAESYARIYENPFLFTAQQPLSTFSIDVDTASYANVRRMLNRGQRPPSDSVRLEELINYFHYDYEGPGDEKPFGVMVDVAGSPWQPLHRLVRVALKGREISDERAAANFVFLVDVSGSMNHPDKLPLVQQSLLMLLEKLGTEDRVAIVTYAGSSGVALPSTVCSQKEEIRSKIESLGAGGSTNGAGGIRLAYEQAAAHFLKGGVNRVILCTDGDFNVGVSTPAELEKLITEKAKSRIFLSVLGFGSGNLKDHTMETLADKGNGNYAYIDSLSEARKVLVEQMHGTLVTIAKDVKIQVEFNPAQVAAYRLLGYENRLLAKEDFNNDKKDAGEIGAGHTVTALYEVVPSNVKFPDGKPLVDDLKYAKPANSPEPAAPEADTPAPSLEMLTVKLRYKQPEGDKSELIEVAVIDKGQKFADSPRDFQFAASVAGFGMLLRGSQHAGELSWDTVRDLALRGKGEDALGYRGEFLQLIDKARGLTK